MAPDRERPHPRPNDADWERIARFLAGECTPAEAREIERWAAADPVRRELLDEAREAWETAGSAPERWNVDAAWARVSARLEPAAAPVPASPVVIPFRRRREAPRRSTAPLRAAAAVVVALAAGGGWWAMRPAPAADVAMREVATAAGQRATVRLADGTEVVLGPASRVRFPGRFGGGERVVRLEGEARFDVAHDPAHPFRVKAGVAEARVLGTRFAVRAVPGEGWVRVAVERGKVAVSPAADTARKAVLTAGRAARVAGDGTLGAPGAADLEAELAWADGRLVFHDAPLSQVASELGRWYGVRVRMDDPALGSLRLTATFRDEPAAEAIEVAALSLGLRVRRENGAVVLFRAGSGAAKSPQSR